MSDIVVPHNIVFNAVLKYAEVRYKELSDELYNAVRRGDDIKDKDNAAIYNHQSAELVAKKEYFRQIYNTLLSSGFIRIVIDYDPQYQVRKEEEIKVDKSKLLPPGQV